jgi:hypothetical protein
MIDIADLSIERPIGSKSNTNILELIKNEFANHNYEVISLPIKCLMKRLKSLIRPV